MVMRAQGRPVGRDAVGGRQIAGAQDGKLDPRPDAELPQDEVVMVLITRDTYERARALGRAYGHGPDATIALALKALQQRAEAAGLVPAAPVAPPLHR